MGRRIEDEIIADLLDLEEDEKPWSPVDEAESRSRTLELLRAHREGLTLRELMDRGIGQPQSRIGELRAEGWRIDADRVPGARYRRYRLVCRQEETEIYAGVVLRFSTSDGWTSRTHREAVRREVVPEVVLQDAEQAAAAAYRRVIQPFLDLHEQGHDWQDQFGFGGDDA